ncbi:MAG: hypothetical protein ACQEQL_08540 [Pseudomonadota bacterium]
MILIAVALFAALSYAVTQTGRGGGDITREEASINASVVLEYLALVEYAFKKMRLSGVPLKEIDFDSDQRVSVDGNLQSRDNLLCTSEYCEIFSPEGGGAPYQSFKRMSPVPMPDRTAGWLGEGELETWLMEIEDLGTELPEMVFMITIVNHDLCKAINRHFGLPDLITSNTNERVIWHDSKDSELNSTALQTWGAGSPATVLAGQRTFCASRPASEFYHVFHVLEVQ